MLGVRQLVAQSGQHIVVALGEGPRSEHDRDARQRAVAGRGDEVAVIATVGVDEPGPAVRGQAVDDVQTGSHPIVLAFLHAQREVDVPLLDPRAHHLVGAQALGDRRQP